MCVLWSQLLFPLALNSKTLFEAIVDAEDQATSSPTYIQWLNGFFSDEVCWFFFGSFCMLVLVNYVRYHGAILA